MIHVTMLKGNVSFTNFNLLAEKRNKITFVLQTQEEPSGCQRPADEAEGQQRPAEVPAGLPGGKAPPFKTHETSRVRRA